MFKHVSVSFTNVHVAALVFMSTRTKVRVDDRLNRSVHSGSFAIRRHSARSLLLMAALLYVCASQALAGSAATTTTLSAKSGGSAVSSGGSITSPAQLTLTAAVLASSTPVTAGTVNFCVSGAAVCSDINFVGTAELTSAGTASYTFVPAIGAHSYVAVYIGTAADATSTSSTYSLTVTGGYATTSVLGSALTSSNPNVYTLTDTVTGKVLAYPSGTISFEDTSNSNYVIGTANLVSGTSTFALNAESTVNTTTNYTRFVAVGDVNGDGIPDIITSLFYGPPGPGVQVFTGKGDGTFNSGTVYSVSNGNTFGPQFVALGDFNNDGCPDILAEAFDTSQIALFLNTKSSGACTGSFQTASYFSGPGGSYAISGPGGLAVGDFNQDGNLDFVVNNNGPSGNTGTDSVVFFGNGAGGFAAATPVQLAPGGTVVPQYTAVADFNGDGLLDLAIANSGTDTFNVYLNNGTGGFTLAHTYSTPVPNVIIKAADLNQDGKIDLAIASGNTSAPITIWKGNGDGSFTQQTSPTVGSVSVASFSVADFNGDGKPDLIYNTSSPTATGDIYIVLGNGDFTFQSPSTGVSTLGNDTLSLAVGDFNGDGYSDVAVGNYSSDSVAVYLSQYDATATATLTGASVSGATANPHPVDAAFSASTPYASSTSNAASLTASVLSDGISLTDLNAPSTSYGQQATFQAVLSPYTSQGYSTNGENVNFYDGASNIGTAPLSSGVATFNISSLALNSHSLTATYTTDGNFATATSSPAVIHSVTPDTDTITVSSPAVSPAAATYSNGGTISITASSTSAQPIAYATTTPLICSVSSAGVVTTLATGTCTVTLNQAAAGNYAAATQVTQAFNIGAGTDAITFPALANTVFGATPPTLSATSTSGQPVTYTSATTAVCTVSGSTITDVAVGTCTIDANQAAAGNYAAAAQVAQSYNVTPATDTITIPLTVPKTATYGSGPISIGATSTSGQPVTYTDTTPSICLVSSTGVVAAIALGTCQITASQPASGNYAAATPVTVTMQIAAESNIITIPPTVPTTAPINVGSISIGATTTSGVPPTYTSTSPTICSVSATGVVTVLAPGTCTVNVSQAATGVYAAAPTQTVSIVFVNTYDFTITADAPLTQTVIPGATVVFTYALASVNGQYPGPVVNYTVAGLPPGSTYSITPASGTISNTGGPQTLTLTINTAQEVATNRERHTPPWTIALLLPIPIFFLRKKRRRLAQAWMVLLLLAFCTLATTGCANPNGFFGQPAGNYSIVVTATSGTITHSAVAVTLQVQ